MTKDKYPGVRLPSDLVKKIDSIIDNCNLGYKSRSEFVKEAVREKLSKIKLPKSK